MLSIGQQICCKEQLNIAKTKKVYIVWSCKTGFLILIQILMEKATYPSQATCFLANKRQTMFFNS